MKIMHIISGGDKGGAKTHMFALLDELCKIADVTVVCLMRGVFYEEILDRNVRTVLLEQHGRTDFSVRKQIERMVREEGFDIINAHGARANFIAMMLNQKKMGIPVVTTIHSDPLLDFDSFVKRLIFMNLNLIALRRIKYKIAVTDSFRQMLIERGFMPNDILTVYNGMDFTTDTDDITSKEEFAKRFGIPYDPSKIYIGIATRFNYVKGVDVFLRGAAEVLKETDEARFVIIGEGEDGPQLKALAKELGIADKVYFLGFVREVYDFLNFIDINMLTSRSESFPYSILEGAKAKKATVASAVGGIPHLVIDSETGLLFDSEDHEECAQKLLYLIKNPNEIKRLGKALYEKASSEFSNKALAETYLSNYDRFIKKFNRSKHYDIILSGYYGFGNFGDDIVMNTLIKEFKKHDPYIQIMILSNNPKNTMIRYGINAKNRYNLTALTKAIKESDNYINGGGTLLTDVTSQRSLAYYSTVLSYAKRKGLNTMLLANGIGPFVHKASHKKLIKALKACDLITLRDDNSYDTVKELGFGDKAHLTADMALMFSTETSSDKHLERLLKSNDIAANGYFTVSLREWKKTVPDFEKKIACCVDHMANKYGLTPIFIPVQPDKDIDISRNVMAHMKTKAVIVESQLENIDFIARIISGGKYTLSMRLHPIICSFACSIPCIGLSYDEKVWHFMSENSAGSCLDVMDLTEEELISAIDSLPNEDPSLSEKRTELLKTMKDRAKKNIDYAIDAMK